MEHNNEEYQKGLGKRIKALIEEADFSIMKFARVTGISFMQIMKWIGGKEKPSDEQLNEILGYTGCKKVDWLRSGDPSSEHSYAQTTESIFFFKTPKVKKNVYHLGYYFTAGNARRNILWIEEVLKKTGGPNFTQRIYDFKYKQPYAIDFFYQEIKNFLLLSGGYYVAVVPSSNKDNTDTGIARLGQRLAKDWSEIKDATTILRRKTTRREFSRGAPRNTDREYEDLFVENPVLIKDKNILLLDDNTTTGASMKACEKRLKESGAKRILCLALTKTLRPDYSSEGIDF